MIQYDNDEDISKRMQKIQKPPSDKAHELQGLLNYRRRAVPLRRWVGDEMVGIYADDFLFQVSLESSSPFTEHYIAKCSCF